MKFVFYSILSVLFLTILPAADRDHPKELAVLERFIGTWDHVVKLTHPGGGRDSIQKTESKRSWSSGGSFLRIEDVNWARPEFDEFQMLLTYDVLEKTYTGVIMDGTDVSKVIATWNEESASMTFDAKGDGGNLKFTIRFVNENQAEGSGTFTSPEGKVVAEVTWQQTRRVKQKEG
jgi:hypothetical protein